MANKRPEHGWRIILSTSIPVQKSFYLNLENRLYYKRKGEENELESCLEAKSNINTEVEDIYWPLPEIAQSRLGRTVDISITSLG